MSDETFFSDMRSAAEKYFAEIDSDVQLQADMLKRLKDIQRGRNDIRHDRFEAGVADSLPNILAPTLQRLLHISHELIGHRAVDQAVVVAEGQVNHRADGD